VDRNVGCPGTFQWFSHLIICQFRHADIEVEVVLTISLRGGRLRSCEPSERWGGHWLPGLGGFASQLRIQPWRFVGMQGSNATYTRLAFVLENSLGIKANSFLYCASASGSVGAL
jgi:hypothetical protein